MIPESIGPSSLVNIPKMPDIKISSNEIECLLKKLPPTRLPLEPKHIVLQTLHKELAHITKSSSKAPWARKNCPGSGKRQMCHTYSKRVTKLTPQITAPHLLHDILCVLCKVLKHIVVSNMSTHFNNQNILYYSMGSENGGHVRHS